MENSSTYGFCPHKRAIAGLDAYYCPDCHRSFMRGTTVFEALVNHDTTEDVSPIFNSWQDLAQGKWGTPISIKAIASNVGVPLSEIILRLEAIISTGNNSLELIPSRHSSRNLKIGNRQAADLTFYESLKSSQLQVLSVQLHTRIKRLEQENQSLREHLKAAQNTLARAKDINEVVRPSFKRVMRLVADACMSLQKVAGGWLLKMGHLSRRFRNLYQIWDLLTLSDWCLSDIFTPAAAAPRAVAPPRLRPRNPSIAPAAFHPIPI